MLGEAVSLGKLYKQLLFSTYAYELKLHILPYFIMVYLSQNMHLLHQGSIN